MNDTNQSRRTFEKFSSLADKIKRSLPRSLAVQLFFLTLLPLTALVLAITFGSVSVHQNAMRSLVAERDERAVRTAASALSEQLSHRIIAIHSLALLAENDSISTPESILTAFDYQLSEFDLGLALFALDGNLISHNGDSKVWEFLKQPAALAIQNRPSTRSKFEYISSAYANPNRAESVILILASIPGGKWVAGGIFSSALMVQHSLTDAFTSGPMASVVVLDPDHRILYNSGMFSMQMDVSLHPGVIEALKGQSGTTFMMMGSEEHVVAYSPITPYGWALVFEEPWEMVETPMLQASQLAPLVLVPLLGLVLIALWFGAHQIVQPLQTLATKAANLGVGNFAEIEETVGGIEEISQLQNELIQMAHKVQAAQQSLHGYIGAITTAQEEERKRLARELHDDTIQALIALKQRVQITQLNQTDHLHAAQALQEIALLTEQTIENLRRLIRAMRPIYLEDLGLVTALEMLIREAAAQLHIPVQLKKTGTEIRLDSEVELALYRIVQEGMSNIIRHANASQVDLTIEYTDTNILIRLEDNGIGFEVPVSTSEYSSAGHYGLLGLFERADLVGANLEIISELGSGTQITISLPIP